MARYRRNIDEDVRGAERQWLEHQDRASQLVYANQLLRAGQLELTAFPFDVIQELFPDGVLDGAMLYGIPVGTIRENLESQVDEMLRDAGPGTDLSEVSRNFNTAYGTTTLIWFPRSHDLSLRYNWKHFDRSNIRIRDGEIDEESLSYAYRALQVDFSLPGHDSGNPPFSSFNHIVVADSLIQNFSYYDEQLDRHAELLVLNNGIPGDWEDNPHVNYGRCEDFPCCGHDMCPPTADGVQLAMVCTCGRLVSRGASSSLCEGCLSGVRREAYYGEDYDDEPYDEDEDEDDDDDDDEDEEDDGSSSPFAPYEDEHLDSYGDYGD